MMLIVLLGMAVVAASSSKIPITSSNQIFDVVNPEPPSCYQQERSIFVRMEVMNCATQPCSMIRGFTYEVAVVFIPQKTTNTLYIGGKYRAGDGSPDFGDMHLSGTFTAGMTYRVARSLSLPLTLDLGPSELEVWLKDNSDIHINRCLRYTVGSQ